MDNTTTLHSATATAGMMTDVIPSQMQEGQLTFAQNAVVQHLDGHGVTYQNEPANVFNMRFKDGYKVIGLKNIIEQDRTIFFLVNPLTHDCEIGQKSNSSNDYKTLIQSPCLNFSIDHPIHKVIVKTGNCNTSLYWTDGNNPRRYLDLDDLPMDDDGKVDCNRLLLQPNFSVPIITPLQEETGGSLRMGAYQFAIQYANALGESYTAYYSITNPISIYEPSFTADAHRPTTKSIDLQIDGLDTSGLYDYFNLAVIETIDQVPIPKLVGTFRIKESKFTYLYTGNTKDEVRLSMQEIFERYPYYDIAQDVTATDNTLVWIDVSASDPVNYQPIWSKVKLVWETYRLPYNAFEGYHNAINTSQYRGYLRDEIYAFEGCFILRNGKVTPSFHIPGPAPRPEELVPVDNNDALAQKEDPCDADQPKLRWQVYNTGRRIDYTETYKAFKAGGDCPDCPPGATPDLREQCYKGSFEYGQFGYWESAEKYPSNTLIWGELADTPIRHHKMPDCLVAPLHDNNPGDDPGYVHSIYPLGIRIDADSLYRAIAASDLTPAQKADIVGFKILRADRVGQTSIIGKGLLYNVGQYQKDGRTFYYQNYPFNDLRPDPFLSNKKVNHHSGDNASDQLQGFGIESKTRFTFHSPDTHFAQPYGIHNGYLKLETVAVGKSRGHFVEVRENAKYKFLTSEAMMIAWAAGFAAAIRLEIGGGFGVQPFQAQAAMDGSNVVAAFQSTIELLRNLAPDSNYAWQYNAIGNYNRSYALPNDTGNKMRTIELGSYLATGMQTLQAGETINNIKRESAVYLKVSKPLPFPHETSSIIPVDNSRHLPAQCQDMSSIYHNDISAYYGAVKRLLADQYGRMYSYQIVDTGYYQPLHQAGGAPFAFFPPVFGGDCFINRFALKKKMAFFISDSVGRPDGTDIQLDELGNVGYPIYYYATGPIDLTVDFGDLQGDIDAITDTAFGNVVSNLISGGTRPVRAGFNIFSKLFGAYVNTIGKANVNLHCAGTKNLVETGSMFFYNYGIPYFFCESTVNVDYRQAANNREGNFFPMVGTDIPDEWLQETNVPIIHDNQYGYNRTYSKQNKETFFDHLREDFDPAKRCLVNFPNRAIYSEKANQEESKNNWLVYRPSNYFDFPKHHGKLTAIDGLEDRKLLVRFENKSLLYNVFATIATTTTAAYLGNPAFFSQPPIDFAETDTGFGGSQHKLFIKTETGHLTVDALRGQVLLHQGGKVTDIASHGMMNWLKENLWFRMKKAFPALNCDNHFNGVGLTGTWDARYKRFLLTKRDYQPLVNDITYENGLFLKEGQAIHIEDPRYFCNASWTLSYSLLTGSWISFHSYVPHFYNAHAGSFETGLQSKGLYTHGNAVTFNRFYDEIVEYILEYPILATPSTEILGAFSDYTTVLKYHQPSVFSEVEDVYFDKAILYNHTQSSGILLLHPKPVGNLALYRCYPIFKADGKEILYTKKDGMYSFNTFWDVVADKTQPFFRIPCNIPSLDKIFDINHDYSILSHKKARIRSKDAKIRLIFSSGDAYKLLSQFTLLETQKSVI